MLHRQYNLYSNNIELIKRRNWIMKLDIDSRVEKNIFVLIKLIGITEALLKKAITVDEAQYIIFSPYYTETLKKEEVDIEIIKLIESGFVLEDIESLLPDLLDTEISNMRDSALEILLSIEKPKVIERWLIENSE